MKEEWLNRIAITWGNRTRQRQVRSVLDMYASATEAVAHHPEMINGVAIEHARKELDFIERHRIQRSVQMRHCFYMLKGMWQLIQSIWLVWLECVPLVNVEKIGVENLY